MILGETQDLFILLFFVWVDIHGTEENHRARKASPQIFSRTSALL
jgi:hypothetical protein